MLTDIVETITPIVEDKIMKLDRDEYTVFYQMAEEYAAKNDLIVSNETANYMILNEKPGYKFLVYNLYSDDGVTHSRKLAMNIYKDFLEKSLAKNEKALPKEESLAKIDIRTINVMTKIPNKEFSINVNGREVIRISNLSIYRGVKIVNILSAVVLKGLFKPLELMCMSPEHQLVEIYSNLIDPSRSSEWKDYMTKELKMRKLLFEGIASGNSLGMRKLLFEGGGREKKYSKQFVLDKEDHAALSNYISKPGHVVLAYKDADRIQIISQYKLEEEEKNIKELLGDKFRIESTINDPRIPTDQRIRKLTLYKISEKVRRPFMDVYNTAGYSLIPFNHEKIGTLTIRRGTLWVIVKHLFVDLWIIRFLYKAEHISKEFYERTTAEITDKIHDAFAEYDGADLSVIFPVSPDNYLGYYEDPDIAIKRMIHRENIESGKTYYPYYPSKAN